jgi:DNA-binding GntR family transcriptional regulator
MPAKKPTPKSAAPAPAPPAAKEGALQTRQVDLCVDRILALIKQGELKPGQRLGEGMLSRMLSMGMAPVKMALDQLAYAGVIERRPRSGSYVSHWSHADYLQIMHLRACIEAEAAGLAARNADDKTLDALLAHGNELDKQIDSYLAGKTPPRDIYKAEIDFHVAIATASGNRWIVRALKDHRVVAECIRAWIDRPETVTSLPTVGDVSHASLATAIKSRDFNHASTTMRMHILSGIDPTESRK